MDNLSSGRIEAVDLEDGVLTDQGWVPTRWADNLNIGHWKWDNFFAAGSDLIAVHTPPTYAHFWRRYDSFDALAHHQFTELPLPDIDAKRYRIGHTGDRVFAKRFSAGEATVEVFDMVTGTVLPPVVLQPAPSEETRGLDVVNGAIWLVTEDGLHGYDEATGVAGPLFQSAVGHGYYGLTCYDP